MIPEDYTPPEGLRGDHLYSVSYGSSYAIFVDRWKQTVCHGKHTLSVVATAENECGNNCREIRIPYKQALRMKNSKMRCKLIDGTNSEVNMFVDFNFNELVNEKAGMYLNKVIHNYNSITSLIKSDCVNICEIIERIMRGYNSIWELYQSHFSVDPSEVAGDKLVIIELQARLESILAEEEMGDELRPSKDNINHLLEISQLMDNMLSKLNDLLESEALFPDRCIIQVVTCIEQMINTADSIVFALDEKYLDIQSQIEHDLNMELSSSWDKFTSNAQRGLAKLKDQKYELDYWNQAVRDVLDSL